MPKLRAGLLVDLDGTVRDTRSGRPHPVKPWDQVIREGVEARLRAFKERGYPIVGITNQGGVAFGYLTENDVEVINEELTQKHLPGLFDLILYCPYHPKGRVPQYRVDSEDRKPKPGMAFKARDALKLDLAKSLMVGDLETDRDFAKNAGIGSFFWPNEFFGANPHPEVLRILQEATRAVAAKKKAAKRRRKSKPKRSGAAAKRRSGAAAKKRSGAAAKKRSGAVGKKRSGAAAKKRSGAAAKRRSGAAAKKRGGTTKAKQGKKSAPRRR